MKVLLLFFLTSSLYAKPETPQILHCIGKEESVFHQNKDNGPLSKLNQEIIHLLGSIDSKKFKTQSFMDYCYQNFSYLFLKDLILRTNEMIIDHDETNPLENQVYGRFKQEVRQRALNIFSNHIAELQKISTPLCLEKHLEGHKNYLEKMRYLQENITDSEKLISNALVKKMFNGLESKKFKSKCLAE